MGADTQFSSVTQKTQLWKIKDEINQYIPYHQLAFSAYKKQCKIFELW